MVVCKTKLKSIPDSCQGCDFPECSLPLKSGKPEIMKAYMDKRHKDCPLIEIDEPEIIEVRK